MISLQSRNTIIVYLNSFIRLLLVGKADHLWLGYKECLLSLALEPTTNSKVPLEGLEESLATTLMDK